MFGIIQWVSCLKRKYSLYPQLKSSAMKNGIACARNASCGRANDIVSDAMMPIQFCNDEYLCHCNPIIANNTADIPTALLSKQKAITAIMYAGKMIAIGFLHSDHNASILTARCAMLTCNRGLTYGATSDGLKCATVPFAVTA